MFSESNNANKSNLKILLCININKTDQSNKSIYRNVTFCVFSTILGDEFVD